MYYLADGVGSKKGLKHLGKILAVIFSVFTLLASFGIGSMGQVNKIVLNVESAFSIEELQNIEVFDGVSLYPVIIGIVIMALASLIILGGLKRIAAFAEKVVPFMVLTFIAASLTIIVVNYANILPAFKAIFTNW